MTLLYSLCLFLILRLCNCQETDPHSIHSCAVLINSLQSKYGNYNITIRSPDVHVTCVNDTTLVGSSNVTCNTNGIWQPQFPHCLVNCPRIPDIPTIISANTTTYVKTKDKNRAAGTMISLSCVTSEYIVDGSSRITCQPDRSWEPNIPKCRPKQFPPERLWMTILAIAGPAALVLVVFVIVLGKVLLKRRIQLEINADKEEEVFQLLCNKQNRGSNIFIKHFEYTIHRIKKDDQGNLLGIDIEAKGKRITSIGLYGPNKDSPEFYSKVSVIQ